MRRLIVLATLLGSLTMPGTANPEPASLTRVPPFDHGTRCFLVDAYLSIIPRAALHDDGCGADEEARQGHLEIAAAGGGAPVYGSSFIAGAYRSGSTIDVSLPRGTSYTATADLGDHDGASGQICLEAIAAASIVTHRACVRSAAEPLVMSATSSSGSFQLGVWLVADCAPKAPAETCAGIRRAVVESISVTSE